MSHTPTETSESGDVLQLKRLLVTMKHKYEKSLHQLQVELQAEQTEKLSQKQDLDQALAKLSASQTLYEEELFSLRAQQNALKDLLKSAQEELKTIRSQQEEKQSVLQNSLKVKEEEWLKSLQLQQQQQVHIDYLTKLLKEKELIQEKYEQLKEEWQQLSEALEESLEMRERGEEQYKHLSAIASDQELQLTILSAEVDELQREKQAMLREKAEFQELVAEDEKHLKIAQQHLAKKVKEVTLLNTEIEDQQSRIIDLSQIVENQKTLLAQLQASVELYQRQEKLLQEQLHEALKGTESKLVKWEEKYFDMYEKWQKSEAQVLELKKLEEKHQQMQKLLSGLGHFMADPKSDPFPLPGPQAQEDSKSSYDLFGMKHGLH